MHYYTIDCDIYPYALLTYTNCHNMSSRLLRPSRSNPRILISLRGARQTRPRLVHQGQREALCSSRAFRYNKGTPDALSEPAVDARFVPVRACGGRGEGGELTVEGDSVLTILEEEARG